MIRLHEIKLSQDGHTLNYGYEVSGAAARYFKKEVSLFATYGKSVADVPQSIQVIPFLANVMPIAWFAGFDVEVAEADATYLRALEDIRREWEIHYPQIKAVSSKLIVGKTVTNTHPSHKTVMLFSGGVDAFATFFRHYDENPALATIQGADIPLSDTKQWQDLQAFIEQEPILKDHPKHYIQTNFQDFYNYHVDQLLPHLGWWGNVQHGLALISLLAPLAYLEGYGKIYIASTRSHHMEFNAWGSMPEIDEKIQWGGTRVMHDGFELKRQDKVDAIVNGVGQRGAKTTVRVCYSDFKQTLNCSVCEKCIRTMFGIVLAGGNPNDFGFQADASLYAQVTAAVNKGFKSRGTQFFWGEILEKATDNTSFFVFADANREKTLLAQTLPVIAQAVQGELVQPSRVKRVKHVIINKYPKAFGYYLKIRRSL